ncbi:MAG: glycoside hydrolase family 127 protein [Chloroflexi bacterium]|nr:glycoside hydrolase family 127 protein [Chloroflexota bacterium]
MTTKRKLKPVPFTQVRFKDAFWAPRIETNRKATIRHIYNKLVETDRISVFDLNFTRPVPSPIVQIFGDSDTAKWLEAASYALATHPDPELETLVDQVADKVISAQQPDGYLNTHFTVVQPDMRWKNLRDWHELYCAGHLMEGAVAHYQATGQKKLLNALSRYADLIDATFGDEPGKKRGYPGHPEIELALVRLYHATGNRRYLDLAGYFVNERGQHSPEKPHYYDLEAIERGEDPKDFWAKTYEYCQAHEPVRDQKKVVGHAVRAMYLFSAVADLADETGDASLLETCDRLWDNLINRRMYITGGIGPSRHNEGFTEDYDLPDETAYAETCATIGLILWNHRLLQFDGDRRFADVMERGIYNGFLSGVSLDGTKFLYENPLSTAGDRHREEWFYCPCCPPNVARIMATIGNYVYSSSEDGLWVHLFAGSETDLEVNGQALKIRQTTQYPWDGLVQFDFELDRPASFTLHIRVPGWCNHFELSVNGETLALQPEENGYLAITREWKHGDQVTYRMDMPIRAIWANPAVRQLEGRVAIQRGPVVYCLEGTDHNQIILDRISVDPAEIANSFTVAYDPDLLGGAAVVRGKGKVIDQNAWDGSLYRDQAPAVKEIALTAIPYCLWDNREPGEMRVWLRTH